MGENEMSSNIDLLEYSGVYDNITCLHPVFNGSNQKILKMLSGQLELLSESDYQI